MLTVFSSWSWMVALCSSYVLASSSRIICDMVVYGCLIVFFFFSSRRRHTRFDCDWSSDVCSSDLLLKAVKFRRVVSPLVLNSTKKFCRKRAVKSVSKRQRLFFFFQLKDWHLGECVAHDVFVFFRLEAASAVNQRAARFQEREDGTNDFQLPRLHVDEIRRL